MERHVQRGGASERRPQQDVGAADAAEVAPNTIGGWGCWIGRGHTETERKL